MHKAKSAFEKREHYWNIEKLRKYIATAKSHFHPSIGAGASTLLENIIQSVGTLGALKFK